MLSLAFIGRAAKQLTLSAPKVAFGKAQIHLAKLGTFPLPPHDIHHCYLFIRSQVCSFSSPLSGNLNRWTAVASADHYLKQWF